MRRQRVLRTSSTQSLCIFCACRLGVDVPPSQFAPFVSRNFSTTTSSRQSTAATAATPDNDNARNASDTSGFVFDPSSPLSQAEQREKAQRHAIWQKRQAREQELKQQRVRDESQELQRAGARRATKRQSGQANTDGFRKIDVNPVVDDSPSSSVQKQGVSLTQAMFNAPRPARTAALAKQRLSNRRVESERPFRERQAVRSVNTPNSRGQNAADTPNTATKWSKVYADGFRKVHKISNREEIGTDNVFPASSTSQAGVVQQSRKERSKRSEQSGALGQANRKDISRVPGSDSSKPKRVALPDFLQSKPKAAEDKRPISGWGAGATEMKAVEYGDGSPMRPFFNTDGSATPNLAIEDAPEASEERIPANKTQPEPTQPIDQQYKDTMEPNPVLREPSVVAPVQAQAQVQDIAGEHERRHDNHEEVHSISATNFPDLAANTHVAAAHHQYNEPQSHGPQYRVKADTHDNATKSDSANIGSFGYYENEHYEEPSAEPPEQPRGAFGLPQSASKPPTSTVPDARRGIPAETRNAKPGGHQGTHRGAQDSSFTDEREDSQNPHDQGPRTSQQYVSNLHSHGQHSNTGYHATPLNQNDLRPSPAVQEDRSAHWQHLRPKSIDTERPQSVQNRTEHLDQQHEQGRPQQIRTAERRSSQDDDPNWVDQMFRAHQEQRPQPRAPMRTATDVYSSVQRSQGRFQNNASRTCGRCGERGHAAHECTGPQKNTNQQSGVRRQQPRSVYDDPYAPEPQNQRSQSSQDHRPFDDPFTRPASAPRYAVSRGPDDPFTAHFDGQPRQQNQRSQPEYDVFNRSPARSQNRFEGRSRIPNPFDSTQDSNTVRFQPNRLAEERQQPTKRGPESRSPENSGPPQEEQRLVEAEEARRNARNSRRSQWETPDEDVQSSNKFADRRKGQRNTRRVVQDEDDELEGARDAYRARKSARQAAKDSEKDAKNKAQRRQREARKAEQTTPITLPEFVSVQHLSQMLGVRYEQFVERLEDLGYDDVFPGKTLNSETSGMIAMEYNFEPSFDTGAREEEERDLKPKPEVEDKELLPVRPPVVTIMGHVDHGKTTILDYLRKSSVAAGEAGGITQHIGAFSVPLASSGKTITFLDTPGHAAFLAMRQRGANVTDIVVLVVAADDSVKPQTLEALKHARAAGVPMIVAINKVDKEEADVQRCKADLARHGVEIEEFGGDIQVVEVSGKTGRGMDELEENVVTLSEILDHRADTDGAVEGWVLEATTKKSGRVATILVRRGTLKPGSIIVAGKTWARVRSLRNEAGKAVHEVGPGMPVEVDGWKDQPAAGDEVLQAPSEQKASSVVEYRLEVEERKKTAQDMEAINEARRIEQERREKEKAAEYTAKRAATASAEEDAPTIPGTVDSPAEQQSGQMVVPFIIKADVSGSVEAVSSYILSISSPLIVPQILQSSVGSIHESDIELASAASGHILAFNLPKDDEMKGAAEARGVKVLENDVIYRLLDDVKAHLEEQLPPVVTQRVLGEADVGAAFEIGVGGRKKIKIAGCKVRNGVINKGARVRISRGGEKVYDGTLSSLKSVKKDVQEMRKGSECGVGFDNWEDFEIGDQIQTYEEISERRKL